MTPNSHSSSTHSVTPQHQMQHGGLGLVGQNKHEDLNSNNNNQTAATTSSNSPQVQASGGQSVLPPDLSMPQSVSARSSNNVEVALSNDPYSFMAEEMSILSPGGQQAVDLPGNSSNPSSYSPVPVTESAPIAASCRDNSMYSIKDHQQSLTEPLVESHSADTRIESQDANNSNCDLNARTGSVPKRRGRKKKLIDADGMQMVAPQQQW